MEPTLTSGLTIAEAAARTGLSAHTLRYYERAGLMLDPVGRAPSTHRRYTEGEIGWVVLLTKLRATGMPIRRMKAYADLVRSGNGNEAERLAMLEAHRHAVLAELEATRRNLAAIDAKIALYRTRIATQHTAQHTAQPTAQHATRPAPKRRTAAA